jgi:hypothetical protein
LQPKKSYIKIEVEEANVQLERNNNYWEQADEKRKLVEARAKQL